MSTTVLAYHAVADCPSALDPHQLAMPVANFRRQMEELARSRSVVSLDDVFQGRVPRGKPAVAITFDDGYRSVLETAAPILHDHGFPATLFVPTRYLGERNRWDVDAGGPFDILEADDLPRLEELGVAVESHGHSHIHYDTSPPEAIEEDLRQSIAILESAVGRRPRYLAYPWGPSSVEARRLVAEAGLEAAFSIDMPDEGRYSVARVAVQTTDGLRLFRIKTSGRYQALRHNPVASMLAAAARPVRQRSARA
jgi:peptidoglycan/xylan/chitin deacetylase (PgdA/CDA1 family)